jgi:hypothetical protein
MNTIEKVYLCGEISQASNIKEYGIKRNKASVQTGTYSGNGHKAEAEVENNAVLGRVSGRRS